ASPPCSNTNPRERSLPLEICAKSRAVRNVRATSGVAFASCRDCVRELAPAAALGLLGLLTRRLAALPPAARRRGGLGAAAGPFQLRRPVLGRPGIRQLRSRVLNSLGPQGFRWLGRLRRQFVFLALLGGDGTVLGPGRGLRGELCQPGRR